MSEPQEFIWLNNVHLPISSPIGWTRITPFPEQLMLSTPTAADYTPTSKQQWGSLKSGMGVEKWTPEDADRYWQAEGVDASINMQSLAPLVTTLGSFGKEPVKLIKFAGKLWAIGNNQISYWSGTAWTSVKTDFPDPTDAVIFYGDS